MKKVIYILLVVYGYNFLCIKKILNQMNHKPIITYPNVTDTVNRFNTFIKRNFLGLNWC